jgi:hypothetical protein
MGREYLGYSNGVHLEIVTRAECSSLLRRGVLRVVFVSVSSATTETHARSTATVERSFTGIPILPVTVMAPRKKHKRKHVSIAQGHQSAGRSAHSTSKVLSKYFPLISINTLPDDVLLEVFDHYRKLSADHWARLQGWYKLAHTCPRWRQLVFASSLRLNLQLRCTFGTPVMDMINHSPPFPLILDYGPHLLKKWTPADEDGVLFALQHLSRTHEIMLSAPRSTLAEIIDPMLDTAPMLRRLVLHTESTEFVLPKGFLDGDVPQLRHLELHGVSLATLHPLLPSATSLVSLVLERVPSSAYFSPESLVAHIRTMPYLRTLSIGFLSTVPRPGLGNQRPLPPRQTSQARIELPVLRQLIYRGVSAYLESLLARIRTPLIQDIDITLFNQLTLSIPRICTFVSDLEPFRPTAARIDFAQTSAHILLFVPSMALQSSESQSQSPDISLSVSCARLDFQISAMAQICRGLSGAGLVLPVEELMLGFHSGGLSEEWRGGGEDAIDPSLWRTLLTSFRQTHTLRVHVALAADLEHALRPPPQPQQDGLVLGLEQELLLPDLRTVVLLHGDDERALAGASETLRSFIDERNRAGHVVNLESQDLSKL